MARFNAAFMSGSVDEKFQNRYNYLLDLLDQGYIVEKMIGNKMSRVEISPSVGIKISYGTTDMLSIDPTTGDLRISGFTPASHLADMATQSELGHIKLQESYNVATLQNGWTGTLQYAKNDLGQVTLKGSLKTGTLTANTVVATLPAGYQPNSRVPIPTIVVETGNGSVGLYMNQTGGLLRVTANSGFVGGNSVLFSIVFDVN